MLIQVNTGYFLFYFLFFFIFFNIDFIVASVVVQPVMCHMIKILNEFSF